jgi:hypothetical protein
VGYGEVSHVLLDVRESGHVYENDHVHGRDDDGDAHPLKLFLLYCIRNLHT